MAEPTRVCADCNQRKPWSDFWPANNGRRRLAGPRPSCKDCETHTRARNERKRLQSDPEYRARKNAYKRELMARLRQDPEWRAKDRDYKREWLRRQRGTTTPGPLLTLATRTRAPMLPVAPFADWLGTLGDTKEAIARRVGMDPRMVYTILKGEYATVEVDTVDRALLAVGDGTTIDSLYPNVSLAA